MIRKSTLLVMTAAVAACIAGCSREDLESRSKDREKYAVPSECAKKACRPVMGRQAFCLVPC